MKRIAVHGSSPAGPMRTKPDKPSRWIWVSWVWLFFASTRTLDTWQAWDSVRTAGDIELTGSLADQALVVLLIALGVYVLAVRAQRTRRILANNRWIVILFAYIVLSIVWSNFPGISIRKSARSVGTLVMVLVVLTEQNPLAAVRALLGRLYMVHIPLSVIAVKYVRNIGVMYNWNGSEEQWTGLTTDKNSLGQVAMCSGVFCVWQIFYVFSDSTGSWRNKLKRSLPYVVLLALTLYLLRGSKNSHSSTAILAFATCTLLLAGLQFLKKGIARSKRVILGLTVLLALTAPLIALGFEALDTTPSKLVVEATGRDMTLTGRTLLWTDVLDNAAKHPLFGVGVAAFWVGPVGYDLYPLPNWSRVTPEWRPEQGHNGYIDTYVELGGVGVLLLVIVIGVAIAGALSQLETNFQLGSIRLALLLLILMSNLTETSFLRGTHDLWFVFLLIAVNLPVRPGRARAAIPLPMEASAVELKPEPALRLVAAFPAPVMVG